MLRNLKKHFRLGGVRIVTACLVILSAVTLIFTSCFPTWSADSKSFVFFSPWSGKLVLRDIEKQKSKVIFESKNPNGVFAMNPDGKSFASVTLNNPITGKFRDIKVTISIHSIGGKQNQVLKKYVLKEKVPLAADPVSMVPAVHWTPDGKTLLVQTTVKNASMALNIESGKTARFDSTLLMPTSDVWVMESPITSDSKSFIGNVIKKDGKVEFGVYELATGKRTGVFDVSKLDKKRETILNAEPQERTVVLPPFWKGTKQIRPIDDGHYIFDLKKRTLTFKPDMRMKVLAEIAKKKDLKMIAELSDQFVLGISGRKSLKDGRWRFVGAV